MRWLFSLAIAAVSTSILAGSAFAAGDMPPALLRVVSAQVIAGYCPGAELDRQVLNTTVAATGAKPGDMSEGGRYHEGLVDHARNLKAIMQIAGSDNPAAACKRLIDFYGPKGSVQPGLARVR